MNDKLEMEESKVDSKDKNNNNKIWKGTLWNTPIDTAKELLELLKYINDYHKITPPKTLRICSVLMENLKYNTAERSKQATYFLRLNRGFKGGHYNNNNPYSFKDTEEWMEALEYAKLKDWENEDYLIHIEEIAKREEQDSILEDIRQKELDEIDLNEEEGEHDAPCITDDPESPGTIELTQRDIDNYERNPFFNEHTCNRD